MKKRTLSLLLALVIVFGFLPVTAQAGQLGNGLEYKVYESHVEITKFVGPENETEVVIPAQIEGLPVTVIGYGAFSGYSKLAKITLPDSLTSIGDSAFGGCKSLTKITLPDSLISIGDYVFSGCNSLNNIKIPDGVSYIGHGAFSNCINLYQIRIPDSVTFIGDSIFYKCNRLSYITLPDGITCIGKNAFFDCFRLSDIDLPKSLATISDYAFFNCNMENVDFPNSLTSIGQYAFDNSSLISINLPANLTSIASGAFRNCTRMDSIYFNGDAPSIESNSFYNVVATAYYPEENITWTNDVMQDYGGTITWVPYTPHIHEYTTVVTAPTCTTQGYTTYTCSCGDSYEADYVDALGHDYADGFCARCGAADPDFEEPVENPFTDVPAGSFYAESVAWALENNLTTGTTGTTFSPNDQCIRAQVVTFLWRAEKTPAPSSTVNPYSDVNPGNYFYNPVLWAVENQITTGLAPNAFGSYEICNRAQVVTFLWRAAGCPEPISTRNPFTDVKSTDFFYKSVLWAVENGITTGMDSSHFGPGIACNRAQVVTFLYRAYN